MLSYNRGGSLFFDNSFYKAQWFFVTSVQFQCIPAEHGSVWFRLLSVCHGTDIQRGQVHTKQLSNPLSAVDVTIFIQHLQNTQLSFQCKKCSLHFDFKLSGKNSPFFSQTCPSNCWGKFCHERETLQIKSLVVMSTSECCMSESSTLSEQNWHISSIQIQDKFSIYFQFKFL